MRLKEHILVNEKLNLNYPIDNQGKTMDTYFSFFRVDDIPFEFNAFQFLVKDFTTFDFPDDIKWIWEIEFQSSNLKYKTHPATDDAIKYKEAIDPYSLEASTGASALKIFSGVATSLKKFLMRQKPDVFFFSAKESKRKRVYDRFAKMVPKFTNYKMKTGKDSLGDKIYIFHRKGVKI